LAAWTASIVNARIALAISLVFWVVILWLPEKRIGETTYFSGTAGH
jgi:hypothetical protein